MKMLAKVEKYKRVIEELGYHIVIVWWLFTV